MAEKMKKMSPKRLGGNRKKGFIIAIVSLAVVLIVLTGVLLFTLGEQKGNDSGVVAQESEESTDGAAEEGTDSGETTEGQTQETTATSGMSIEDVQVPVIFN